MCNLFTNRFINKYIMKVISATMEYGFFVIAVIILSFLDIKLIVFVSFIMFM